MGATSVTGMGYTTGGSWYFPPSGVITVKGWGDCDYSEPAEPKPKVDETPRQGALFSASEIRKMMKEEGTVPGDDNR